MTRENPFNVLGLLAGASEKDIAQRKAQINAYLSVGKEISFPEDIPVAVNGMQRTPQVVATALASIDQYSKRALHGLFWFTDGGRADGPALAHLRAGDEEKARDIWYRVVSMGPLTPQTISSCSNLGTLGLVGGAHDPSALLVGLRWKVKVFGSEHFPDFLTRLSDASVAKDLTGFVLKWADQLAAWLLPTYGEDKQFMKKLGDIFDTEAGTLVASLRKPFEQYFERELERLVATCEASRKAKPADSDLGGLMLLTNGRAMLQVHQAFAGSGNIGYEHTADLMAEEFIECAIKHYNTNVEAGTIRVEAVRSLMKAAASIAHGRMLKARIADNAKIMEENFAEDDDPKELRQVKPALDNIHRQLQDFDQMIDAGSKRPVAIIEMVNAFVTSCTHQLVQVRSALGEGNELYLNVSSAVVNRALQQLIEVVNEAQKDKSNEVLDRALNLPPDFYMKRMVEVVGSARSVVARLVGMDMHPQLRMRLDKNRRILAEMKPGRPGVRTEPDASSESLKSIAIAVGIFLFVGFLISSC